MTGMPQETPQPPTAFVKSSDKPSTRLLRVPEPGRATVAVLAGTCSPDTRSAWCTSFAVMASRSLPWLTVGADLAIGGRVSDTPSNFRMQRPALRAAADPGRWTDTRPLRNLARQSRVNMISLVPGT